MANTRFTKVNSFTKRIPWRFNLIRLFCIVNLNSSLSNKRKKNLTCQIKDCILYEKSNISTSKIRPRCLLFRMLTIIDNNFNFIYCKSTKFCWAISKLFRFHSLYILSLSGLRSFNKPLKYELKYWISMLDLLYLSRVYVVVSCNYIFFPDYHLLRYLDIGLYSAPCKLLLHPFSLWLIRNICYYHGIVGVLIGGSSDSVKRNFFFYRI